MKKSHDGKFHNHFYDRKILKVHIITANFEEYCRVKRFEVQHFYQRIIKHLDNWGKRNCLEIFMLFRIKFNSLMKF